jgi:hypothetical protein
MRVKRISTPARSAVVITKDFASPSPTIHGGPKSCSFTPSAILISNASKCSPPGSRIEVIARQELDRPGCSSATAVLEFLPATAAARAEALWCTKLIRGPITVRGYEGIAADRSLKSLILLKS